MPFYVCISASLRASVSSKVFILGKKWKEVNSLNFCVSDKPFFSSTLDWLLVKVSGNFFLLWRWKYTWEEQESMFVFYPWFCFTPEVLSITSALEFHEFVSWTIFFPIWVWFGVLYSGGFFFFLCYGIFINYYIKTFKLHFTYMFSLCACLYVWLCACQDIVWRSEDSFNELVLFFLGMELRLLNLVTSAFIHWVRHLTNQFFGSFFLLSVFTVFLSYKSCYMNAILTELTHYVFSVISHLFSHIFCVSKIKWLCIFIFIFCLTSFFTFKS